MMKSEEQRLKDAGGLASKNLTLRDHFAGQCLLFYAEKTTLSHEARAKHAYQMADAMLEARKH